MANWVHIENGEIAGRYDILPKNWRNVSGLILSKDDLPFLKSIGWYPVVKRDQIYNSSTHYISDYKYEIRENDVLETYVLSEKTPEDFSLLKNQFMEMLRSERNQKLIESDWTQLLDVQNLFDEELKNNWLIYRQNLRNITELYFDNDIINIAQVDWPIPPNG